MPLPPLTWTRLEKAAYDNGFDVEAPRIDDWRTFRSSQTSLRIWLSGLGESLFIVAVSRWEVFEAPHSMAWAPRGRTRFPPGRRRRAAPPTRPRSTGFCAARFNCRARCPMNHCRSFNSRPRHFPERPKPSDS